MIVPGHYTDIVEERNIVSLCGYPLCTNPLGPQPLQRYHISLAQKKVFDLTQRKVSYSGTSVRTPPQLSKTGHFSNPKYHSCSTSEGTSLSSAPLVSVLEGFHCIAVYLVHFVYVLYNLTEILRCGVLQSFKVLCVAALKSTNSCKRWHV